MPSMTNRPANDAQREEIVTAMHGILAAESPETELVLLIHTFWAAAGATYSAARATWLDASAKVKDAREHADLVDADFERTLLLFAESIQGQGGKAVPRVVAELLGGVGPSELTRLSLREEIACAHDLLMRLPKRAYLNYDASLAQALSACIADLEDAAEVLEKAQRALRGVASTMSAAKDDFDAAYAKLLRAVKAQLSASVLRSHFPSFAAAEDPPDAFARSAVRHG